MYLKAILCNKEDLIKSNDTQTWHCNDKLARNEINITYLKNQQVLLPKEKEQSYLVLFDIVMNEKKFLVYNVYTMLCNLFLFMLSLYMFEYIKILKAHLFENS